jgi:hypothetical protein
LVKNLFQKPAFPRKEKPGFLEKPGFWNRLYYGGTKDPHTNPKRQRGFLPCPSLTLRVGVRIFRAAVITSE